MMLHHYYFYCRFHLALPILESLPHGSHPRGASGRTPAPSWTLTCFCFFSPSFGTITHLFLKTFCFVPAFFWTALPSGYDCARLLKRYSGIPAAGCTVQIHNKCISRRNTPIDCENAKGLRVVLWRKQCRCECV